MNKELEKRSNIPRLLKSCSLKLEKKTQELISNISIQGQIDSTRLQEKVKQIHPLDLKIIFLKKRKNTKQTIILVFPILDRTMT